LQGTGGADKLLQCLVQHVLIFPTPCIAACRRMGGQARLARLAAYPWSSYGGYAVAAEAQEFVTYDVLKECGSDLSLARRTVPRVRPGVPADLSCRPNYSAHRTRGRYATRETPPIVPYIYCLEEAFPGGSGGNVTGEVSRKHNRTTESLRLTLA